MSRSLVALTVAACANAALATTYTDRSAFNAVFPGLSLQTFEGASDTQRDYTDFELASGAAGGTGVGTTTTNFPSRVAFGFFADDNIDIIFDTPVQAVGFQVCTYDFFDAHALENYIAVFDPGGMLIEQILPYATNGRTMTTFIGFGNLGPIGRVRIGDLPNQPGLHALDDVAYSVPAPSTMGALLVLVAVRRRR